MTKRADTAGIASLKDACGGAAPYAKGAAFERAVCADLAARGYWTVRSAGSGGLVDVIAFPRQQAGPALLVQCKRDGRLSAAAWNSVFDLARELGQVAVLASKPERGNIQYEWLKGRAEGGKRPKEPQFPSK